MEAYKAALRNSAICGPEVMQNGLEKRDVGKVEQFVKPDQYVKSDQFTKVEHFRRKRRCKSISAPSINEISDLEVSLLL